MAEFDCNIVSWGYLRAEVRSSGKSQQATLHQFWTSQKHGIPGNESSIGI